MPEPTTSTAIGICAGAAIALPCTLMGASTDAALIGLWAATLATFWLDKLDDRSKAFWAVLCSATTAAYGATFLARVAVAQVPSLGDAVEFRCACAFLIGLFGPTVIPKLIKRGGERAEEV